ncbi:hypothetical protein X975_24587, partial [Stegodyphus mimosarum]
MRRWQRKVPNDDQNNSKQKSPSTNQPVQIRNHKWWPSQVRRLERNAALAKAMGNRRQSSPSGAYGEKILLKTGKGVMSSPERSSVIYDSLWNLPLK